MYTERRTENNALADFLIVMFLLLLMPLGGLRSMGSGRTGGRVMGTVLLTLCVIVLVKLRVG